MVGLQAEGLVVVRQGAGLIARFALAEAHEIENVGVVRLRRQHSVQVVDGRLIVGLGDRGLRLSVLRFGVWIVVDCQYVAARIATGITATAAGPAIPAACR